MAKLGCGLLIVIVAVIIGAGKWYDHKMATDPEYRAKMEERKANAAEESLREEEEQARKEAEKRIKSWTPKPGEKAVLRVQRTEQGDVLIATTEEIYEDLLKAVLIQDEARIREYVDAKKAVFAQSGTPVLILKRTFTLAQVRILQEPNANKVAWVDAENLAPVSVENAATSH